LTKERKSGIIISEGQRQSSGFAGHPGHTSYSHLAVSRHSASPPFFQAGDFKNKVAL